MSAFGRRGGNNGSGGARPAFGVARPMKGGAVGGPVSFSPADPDGGGQFPPIDSMDFGAAVDEGLATGAGSDAMSRLADRMALNSDAPVSKNEGFEASIHRIKEQVLPRLLERVDPEAAATL